LPFGETGEQCNEIDTAPSIKIPFSPLDFDTILDFDRFPKESISSQPEAVCIKKGRSVHSFF
jgi:hypothetical protein